MRAVRITEPGGPDVLRLEEDVPDPEPAADEVLVDVRASALNRADLMQREGRYPAPPGAPPDVPGLEFAGEVADVGERAAAVAEAAGVAAPRPGDRVMGLLGGGGYATRAVTSADLLLPVPDGLAFAEAAAIPEVFLTAYDALFRQAGLGVGERVLIHSAGGGVGTAALQLAAAGGASLVVGTASAPKLDGIREAGLPVDVTVDYREASFRRVVGAETGGRGVDVILDTVGGDYWDDNVASLAELGRLVLVGLLGGRRAEVDLGALLRGRLRVLGTVLRARSRAEKADLTAEVRRRVLPLFDDGRLRPVVDRIFPLEAAADAHRHMGEDRNLGKVVLET